MVKFICDKCGEELSELTAHMVYSHSKCRMTTLCLRCMRQHDEALRKADEDFYKSKGR